MPLTAAEIMTTNVAVATPDDSIAKVAGLLSERGISGLPVCDATGAVVGLISEGDLIHSVGATHAPRRAWWLHLLSEGEDLSPDFLESIKVGNRRIADLMVKPVITASPETTVPELADLLAKHHLKRLPIVKNGKLVGIVSRADLIRAFARSPDTIVEPDLRT